MESVCSQARATLCKLTAAWLSRLRREGLPTAGAPAAESASEGVAKAAGCRSIDRRASSRLCRCRWCRPARLPRRVRLCLLEPKLSPEPASDAGAGGVPVTLCIRLLPENGSRGVVLAPCR